MNSLKYTKCIKISIQNRSQNKTFESKRCRIRFFDIHHWMILVSLIIICLLNPSNKNSIDVSDKNKQRHMA